MLLRVAPLTATERSVLAAAEWELGGLLCQGGARAPRQHRRAFAFPLPGGSRVKAGQLPDLRAAGAEAIAGRVSAAVNGF